MAVLDRLTLLLMLAALAAILTAAQILQFAFGEIPCPLCLLERYAMLGCGFGIIRQLRAPNARSGAGIGIGFAVLLLVISARQTLIDIAPRPGHDYVGSAVFGLHMPVWSVVIAVALLCGFAVSLTLSDGRERKPPGRVAAGLGVYLLLICAVNFAAVIVQCGLGQCHTTGYRLLP